MSRDELVSCTASIMEHCDCLASNGGITDEQRLFIKAIRNSAQRIEETGCDLFEAHRRGELGRYEFLQYAGQDLRSPIHIIQSASDMWFEFDNMPQCPGRAHHETIGMIRGLNDQLVVWILDIIAERDNAYLPYPQA